MKHINEYFVDIINLQLNEVASSEQELRINFQSKELLSDLIDEEEEMYALSNPRFYGPDYD